ncbi:hypothetical protein ACFSUK_34765 [Sphingobium scionense]
MPRFTAETAIAALEIEQLVIEWGYDLDLNGGMNVAPLCTDDCHYLVGGTLHQGHGPITAFYTARNERVATQQKDGVRTQRHTITNMRIQFLPPTMAARSSCWSIIRVRARRRS